MQTIIIFGIGLLFGSAITIIVSMIKSVGSLRIDSSDLEDKPYLFLELSKDVDFLTHKKYITLKVNLKSFIPHK